MTKEEINDVADAVSSCGVIKATLVNKEVLVQRLVNKLAKHGAFNLSEFRRRCYS